MTAHSDAVLTYQTAIKALPEPARQQVETLAAELRRVVTKGGPSGRLALALVHAENAAAVAASNPPSI